MCPLVQVKLHFPEIPSLYVCMLMVREGHRDVLIVDLLGAGGSSSLLWLTCKAATRPAAVPPPLGSCFSLSHSWARCVLSPIMKGPGFSKTPALPRSKPKRITWALVHTHGLQTCACEFQIVLDLPNLTSSYLPDCLCLWTSSSSISTELTDWKRDLN